MSKRDEADPDKIWTEEEVLADEDLWRVSDDEEPEEKIYNKKGKQVEYNPNSRNKQYYEDEEELKEEQVSMARFLIE